MDVEELRTEVSLQSDRYDNLWLAHGTLLEEAHKLHFEVIALRLGVRVEGVGVGLGSGIRSPRVLASDTEGPVISLRHYLTVPRVLTVGM